MRLRRPWCSLYGTAAPGAGEIGILPADTRGKTEGQQKNAIIAYKLSEVEIFKKVKKTSPILILDDLFSELDMQKIENILNLLDKEVQTFITTTDVDNVLETIKSNSKIIEIYDGKIKEDTDERSRT